VCRVIDDSRFYQSLDAISGSLLTVFFFTARQRCHRQSYGMSGIASHGRLNYPDINNTQPACYGGSVPTHIYFEQLRLLWPNYAG
jgi:hypothetical protein